MSSNPRPARGLLVSVDLRWHEQCVAAASKANKVLTMLARSFYSREISVWVKLYKSLVRLHLEFASSVWNPHLVSDINIVERVQRRATKMANGCRYLSYDERLTKFKLTNLVKRRLRGDLIQFFKIIKGLGEVNFINFDAKKKENF